jgi:hypothetical protein
MPYKTALILAAGLLFCISTAAFLLVKIFLRPKDDSGLDDCHWEFEDTHPALKRYTLWSRICFTGVMISMLLLFLAVSI